MLSTNIGNNISSVQSWFNNGLVVSDAWIGESAVSGAVLLGDGGNLPSSPVFGSIAPFLQGFTLGLILPVAHKSYAAPYLPPAILTAVRSGNKLVLSWPLVRSLSRPPIIRLARGVTRHFPSAMTA